MGIPPKTISVEESDARLPELLQAVEEGDHVAILRNGEAVARLVKATEAPVRRWGCFEGQVRMTDDAWDSMSADDAAEWESGSIAP